jgi:hypothetical protein
VYKKERKRKESKGKGGRETVFTIDTLKGHNGEMPRVSDT